MYNCHSDIFNNNDEDVTILIMRNYKDEERRYGHLTVVCFFYKLASSSAVCI